jgi:probable HAF family extracellular repeat protein
MTEALLVKIPRSLTARFVALLSLALAGASWAAPPVYRVTDLGLPQGASSSQPAGLNDAGEVLGHASVFDQYVGIRPFLWSPTTGTRWWDALLISGRNEVNALNGRGRVAGTHQDGQGRPQAFIWTEANGVRLIGGLVPGGSSFGNAINDRAQMVGSADDAGGQPHLFVWSAKQGMVDRHPAGASNSYGYAINRSGQVAGMMTLPDGRQRAIVVGPDGDWTKLGCIGADNGQPCHSQALGINDGGEVVGVSGTGSRSHGFIWSAEAGMRDIAADGPYAGAEVKAQAINAAGQVVGSLMVQNFYRAAYWDATNGLHDIADLIDPADPLVGKVKYTAPIGINAAGQIALSGEIDGVKRTVVLTPLR